MRNQNVSAIAPQQAEHHLSERLYSHDAESSVLGCVLLDASLMAECRLTQESFNSQVHRRIFAACLALHLSRTPIDLITLQGELERRNELDMIGGFAYLVEIAKNTPSSANFSAYQEIVQSRYQLRKTYLMLREALPRLERGENVSDELASSLMRIAQPSGKYEHGPEEIARAAVDAIERYQMGFEQGVTYGIPDLDAAANGAHNSDLVIIAARPAMGKTALLLNMILGALAVPAGHSVGFISAEMPVAQIGTRICCMDGRVNSHKMRTGQLDDEDWARLTAATGRLIGSKLRVFDKSGVSIGEIERLARRWKHEHGLTALYVDYLQRIKGVNPNAERWQQVGDNVMRLKELARELDIPVICLAQVNRACEERGNKRPGMGDIANSSEVEKEADQIMVLYRDEVYDESSTDKGTAEINYVKNRHGPTGVVRVRWQAPFMRFCNLKEDY
ncbi:TPA: replicative DNA helicase [Aeromonas hydrophila]